MHSFGTDWGGLRAIRKMAVRSQLDGNAGLAYLLRRREATAGFPEIALLPPTRATLFRQLVRSRLAQLILDFAQPIGALEYFSRFAAIGGADRGYIRA